MTETLPPCPRLDCTFVASEGNPDGHHWHGDNGLSDPPIGTVSIHVTEDVFGEPCRNGDSDSTRCYSARQPADRATYRDAITGEFVTAEHAAANPDTTVSESPCAECERLRGIIHTQGVAIDGYREDVERLRAAEPIVRTVGDLTARHIGKRVRLDEYYDAKLETIFAHDGGKVSLNFTHPEGFAFGCSRPLDTPCEVLG